MENNYKFERFIAKLEYWLNDKEKASERAEEKFFGKYDIAILKFLGILLILLILIVGLRFVVEPRNWYLVDRFSIIFSVIITYFIVIRKLFKKKKLC